MARSPSLLFLFLVWSVVGVVCCLGSSDHNLLRAQTIEREGHVGQQSLTADPEQPRGYKQWVAYFISYYGSGSLVIGNASLDWGKWYDYPNKDKEISSPNGLTVSSGGQRAIVAATGRKSSPSGTEGSFTLWSGQQRVVLIRFDCPFIGSNSQSIVTLSTNFIVEKDDAPSSGPIGIINVNIYARPSAEGITTIRPESVA